MNVLLGLKTKFKSESGQDWKPNLKPPAATPATPTANSGNDADTINDNIVKQGDKVRDLKGKKADKSEIDASVKELLALKAKYKEATGKDWKPGVHQPSKVK